MKKYKNDNRGGVTVFVTLILIPSVMFIAFFIDLSIRKISNPINALKLQGESALSNYDGLLKSTYGLFALSRDVDLSQLNEGNLTYDPNYSQDYRTGENALSNEGIFNPMRTNISSISVELPYHSLYIGVQPYNLYNNNIFQTQISDYMKYRAPVSYFNELSNVSKTLEIVDKMEENAKTIQSKTEFEESIEKLNNEYEKLYKQIVKNDEFTTGILDLGKTSIKLDSENITMAIPELATAKEKLESLQAASNASDNETDEVKAKRRKEIKDAETLVKNLENGIETLATHAANAKNNAINELKEYKNNLEDMEKTIEKIKKLIPEAQANQKKYEADCAVASKELQDALKKEMETYNKCFSADATKVYEKVANNVISADKAIAEFESMKYGETDFSSISKYNIPAVASTNSEYTAINWLTVKGTSPEIQSVLVDDWYAYLGDDVDKQEQREKKKEGESQKKAAEEKLKERQKKLKEKIKAVTQTIPVSIYDTWQGGATAHKDNLSGSNDSQLTKDMTDRVLTDLDSCDESFLDALGGFTENLMHKMFLVEYDLGMFTCFTTNNIKQVDLVKETMDKGKKPEVSGETARIEGEESLTGIEKSTKLNYLYLSELEYIYAGNSSAATNLLASSGTMLGVLFVRNFVTSYSVPGVDAHIDAVSNALACGNPFKKIIADLALRTGVSTIESVDEILELTDGGTVAILKNSQNWKFQFGAETGDDLASSDEKKEIEKGLTMNYEQFMRMLLLVFVPRDKLLTRTGNLIELNITNYEKKLNGNGVGYKEPPTFMRKTANTAVRVKWEQKLGFLMNSLAYFGLDEDGLSHTFDSSKIVGY